MTTRCSIPMIRTTKTWMKNEFHAFWNSSKRISTACAWPVPKRLKIAEERYAEFPEAGELFVLRMLQPGSEGLKVAELDLNRVREYLGSKLS